MSDKYINIQQHIGGSWVDVIDIGVRVGATDNDAVEMVGQLAGILVSDGSLSITKKVLATSNSIFLTEENSTATVITAACGPVRMNVCTRLPKQKWHDIT